MANALDLRVLAMSFGGVVWEEIMHTILAVKPERRTGDSELNSLLISDGLVLFLNQEMRPFLVERPVCRMVGEHRVSSRAMQTVIQTTVALVEHSMEGIR